MTTVTTYTQARTALASLCDEVASTREPVIIRRRNAEDVALVSADELASLLETAHLLRSPKKRPTPSHSDQPRTEPGVVSFFRRKALHAGNDRSPELTPSRDPVRPSAEISPS